MSSVSEIARLRTELVRLRQHQREQYARFMELANKACLKWPNIIRYSRDHHEFYQAYIDGGYKANQTARLLLKLQKNIAQHAMLVLELEHSIDHEERKNEKNGVCV